TTPNICDIVDKPLLVGYALYHYTYSTWEGRSIYMGDLYVKPEFKKKIENIVKSYVPKMRATIAIEMQCPRLDFVVLNWNVNSIDYYKQKSAFDLTGT
ncbi:thialysine N-epsilon-acetyltransferase-like, partial [Mytilus californianus]|uniref:thialysine N-epsilon-acetyltransferase-like n=1 Tax=Mytilus californianus TaxID=6549 RepID=UPI0022455A77